MLFIKKIVLWLKHGCCVKKNAIVYNDIEHSFSYEYHALDEKKYYDRC